MATKTVIMLSVLTVSIQSALGLCISSTEPACASAPLNCNGRVGTISPFIPAASAGGSFVVTSSSPIAPTGISVISENVYEGTLCAGGNLPLLGSVGVKGEFANAGAGAVSYGCGDDDVAIGEEDDSMVTGIVAPVIPTSYTIAPLYAAPLFNGYGLGGGFGYGYGGIQYGFGGVGYGYGLYRFGSGIGFGGCGCGF